MDTFLKYWFGGYEGSLSRIDETSRSEIYKECGKACPDSYTRQVYTDDEEFFAVLKKTFAEMETETQKKNRLHEIRYRFCACDLVKSGFVSPPYHCECSRGSLKYDLESVWGEGRAEVTLVESILAGAPCCRFEIRHKAEEKT